MGGMDGKRGLLEGAVEVNKQIEHIESGRMRPWEQPGALLVLSPADVRVATSRSTSRRTAAEEEQNVDDKVRLAECLLKWSHRSDVLGSKDRLSQVDATIGPLDTLKLAVVNGLRT